MLHRVNRIFIPVGNYLSRMNHSGLSGDHFIRVRTRQGRIILPPKWSLDGRFQALERRKLRFAA
jgi:hypothetical protein